MKCPACGLALAEMTVGGVKVDLCREGCGGIWFDHLELQQVDDVEEAAGETLAAVSPAVDASVRPGGARACPRCGHPAMTQHRYGPRSNVLVDECNRCEGIWLDGGELAAIRAEFTSGADRQAATQAVLDEMAASGNERILAEEQEAARQAGPQVHEPFILYVLRTVFGMDPRKQA